MPYKYDIFISYRRNPATHVWIKKHFAPLVRDRVDFELGRPPAIFIDDQLEAGSSWPVTLGRALGSSRTLIALWTKMFPTSLWCMQEVGVMASREKRAGLRTPAKPYGLIIPAFIHDGDSFPRALSDIQYLAIQDYFNSRIADGSPLGEQLEAKIAERAQDIATCIDNAPEWDPNWPLQAAESFLEQFHKDAGPKQTAVPRFTQQ